MMDKIYGKFVFECDGDCLLLLETETSDFDSARKMLRDEGWQSVKGKNDEWKHYCPDHTI